MPTKSRDCAARAICYATLLGTSALVSNAPASVRFEVIDMGIPSNGTLLMTGYHGFVVRAVSDEGLITRINVGDQNGVAGEIAGGIAQRWEDPTASGNSWGEDFIVRSAGPFSANNTFDSDLNFDSHFTFNPASVTLEALSVGPYQSMPTATTFETITGPGFIIAGDFPGVPPGFMPLPSTPSVGYGAALYPFPGSNFGHLLASFQIHDAARSRSFDFAYVVSNSAFDVYGIVAVEGGASYATGERFFVPEPSCTFLGLIFVRFISGRNRNEHRVT